MNGRYKYKNRGRWRHWIYLDHKSIEEKLGDFFEIITQEYPHQHLKVTDEFKQIMNGRMKDRWNYQSSIANSSNGYQHWIKIQLATEEDAILFRLCFLEKCDGFPK